MFLALLLYFGLSVAVGAAANSRGRSGLGWFFLSVFITPLLAGVFLLLFSPAVLSPQQTDWSNQVRCPFCAEPVRVEARICRHCRSELPTADHLAFHKEYPRADKGIRYRIERDGTVVMSTPDGPRRFKNWEEFWPVISDPRLPDSVGTARGGTNEPMDARGGPTMHTAASTAKAKSRGTMNTYHVCAIIVGASAVFCLAGLYYENTKQQPSPGAWTLGPGEDASMAAGRRLLQRDAAQEAAASVESIARKCSVFADAKARAGGQRQLLYSSCMQFDGDPADAWREGGGQ